MYQRTALEKERRGGSCTHLDIALTSTNGEALLEELAEWEGDVSLSGVGVGRTGGLGDVETGNAEAASGADGGNESLQDGVGLLGLAVSGDRLVADSCTYSISGVSYHQ